MIKLLHVRKHTLSPSKAAMAPPREWPTMRRLYPSHSHPAPSNEERKPELLSDSVSPYKLQID